MFAHALLCLAAFAANGEPLAGTGPLTVQGDIPMQMVAGIDTYLNRALEKSVSKRAAHRQVDTSSDAAYINTIEPVRKRFASIIGAIDVRNPSNMEVISKVGASTAATSAAGDVYRVRWRVFRNVEGEGLLIEPRGTVYAQIVWLPDCDETPEAFLDLAGAPSNSPAWKLAGSGVRVIVPVLINRSDEFSGTPGIRMTNQPHREFIYRTGYELGRHIIGYEVQKVLSCIDWLESEYPELRTGLAGYGEGGLVALYAAALADNLDAAVVSGYFQPRERVWSEPIYRNVWALLHEFGDAEIASLIAPRPLLVEACAQPEISGPPAERDGRTGAAPGAITTPSIADVTREVERARSLVAWRGNDVTIDLVDSSDAGAWSEETIAWLMKTLAVPASESGRIAQNLTVTSPTDIPGRMQRQVRQLVDDTQYLMHQAEFRRKEFWSKADASSPETWAKTVQPYREYFDEEVIGALPKIELPPNARTRLVYDQPTYLGYEVVMDVLPDVFAYGILLVPKNIDAGEKRPVVVCQHGLEGRVQEVADPAVDSPYYHQFACKLAEQGFIAYAPQNPYIGEDKFRVLQRKANPLKLSLFSFIVRQHEQTLNWLGSLPFVDPERIAFYGLSYGGKTAMRVPALLDEYCLSICSGDYNEWIWKCVSVNHPLSYIFTGEDEMWEWNLGNTFNHAEMSWLIYPRPFMVERGHHDGVGYDEWVAYEFAKTKRHYVLLGSGEDAVIEYFNGPHTINGAGTFAFLHEKLKWPTR